MMIIALQNIKPSTRLENMKYFPRKTILLESFQHGTLVLRRKMSYQEKFSRKMTVAKKQIHVILTVKR